MEVEDGVIIENFEILRIYSFIIILWDHQVCMTRALLTKLSYWPKILSFSWSTLACLYKIMKCVQVAYFLFSFAFLLTLYFTDLPGYEAFLISQ